MTPPAPNTPPNTPMSLRQKLHPIAGGAALLTISLFWMSTAISELAGSEPLIRAVKMAVPWGFLLLVPALVLTGASGAALAKGRQGKLISAKQKRMSVIAANGVLVLVPAALFLAAKADAGEIDAVFYSVQAIELVAGAVNVWLLTLNMRDGLKMTARRRQTDGRQARQERARQSG